jgi:hypothetical protein
MTPSVESAHGTVLGAVTKVPPLWGDGLLDRSLASHWYPRTWDDVDLDELTFFMPGLTRLASPENGGVAAHVRMALARRVGIAMGVAQDCAGADAARDKQRLRDIIEDCAGLNGLISNDLPVTAHGKDDGGRYRHIKWRPVTLKGRLDDLVYELSVLQCLGSMLEATAAGPGALRTGQNVSVADALVASIHSGINAAYVYPHLAWAHETFSAGAWLGIVLSGRRALLPEMIAARLVEASHSERASQAAADPADRVLAYHAEICVGRRRMSRLAHRALRRSRPLAVSARPPLFNVPRLPWRWNEDLSGGIERRLSRYVRSTGYVGEERTCNVISAR